MVLWKAIHLVVASFIHLINFQSLYRKESPSPTNDIGTYTTTIFPRRYIAIIIVIAVAVVSIFFAIKYTTGTFNQFYVVASGSMIPTFQVGDVLVVHYAPGNITVPSDTASKKVEVVVLQTLSENTSKIDPRFGSILTAPLPPTNTTDVGIVLITPNYGSTPVASVSIPFTGNALALHTLSGEPFVASYSVSYMLGQPTFVNHIGPVDSDIAASSSSSSSTTMMNSTSSMNSTSTASTPSSMSSSMPMQ